MMGVEEVFLSEQAGSVCIFSCSSLYSFRWNPAKPTALPLKRKPWSGRQDHRTKVSALLSAWAWLLCGLSWQRPLGSFRSRAQAACLAVAAAHSLCLATPWGEMITLAILSLPELPVADGTNWSSKGVGWLLAGRPCTSQRAFTSWSEDRSAA